MQRQSIADPLLDRIAAAQYIGVKPGTLAVWKCNDRHALPYIKIGRLIRYRKSDLDQFIEGKLSR